MLWEFRFPEKEELKLRLKDMLEEQVDEKYYLSEKMISFYQKNEQEQKAKGNGFRFGVSDGNVVAKAVTTRAGGRMDDNYIQQVGKLDIKGHDSVKRVYSDNGISPTLTDMQGGNRQPKIIEEPFIVASRGRNPENPSSRETGIHTEQRLEPNTKGITNTITSVQKDNYVAAPEKNNLRIRKLTPKECWRLMGFTDEEFEKAQTHSSNSQLYKQAGNSIVVNVLEEILKNLLEE